MGSLIFSDRKIRERDVSLNSLFFIIFLDICHFLEINIYLCLFLRLMFENQKTLLFFLACGLIVIHYALVIFGNKLSVDPKHIDWSADLAKFVVGAWIGSIIGGVQL